MAVSLERKKNMHIITNVLSQDNLFFSTQERVEKVTVITRRKIDNVSEVYDVDVDTEEQEGRLVQHVEG